MKIGVSTLALYPKSLDEILVYLENLDVKYCEIINEYPYELINNDLLDSYDIQISIHAPISDINIASHNDAIRNSSILQIKNSMEIASKMNSEIVVVHPGHIPILGQKFNEKIIKNNLNSLLECSKYAQDCGIIMCVENMPNIDGLLCRDLKELNDILHQINAYMTLDIGHAHNMKIPINHMLKYDKIKHIHMSDNDGSFDNHNALGSSDLDFKLILDDVKRKKYEGIMVIEVKHPHEVRESLDYIKSRI